MAAAKYRLNRYNWLGQKLLAQYKYDEILRLRQCLGQQSSERAETNPSSSVADEPKWHRISEHMVYLSSLALMQTGTHLDEVIYAIQQLNFESNNQYFLLLCRCLLYLGNHESVIALCERIIAKEINNSQTTQLAGAANVDLDAETSPEAEDPAASHEQPVTSCWPEGCSPLDDGEFKKLFQRVGSNSLVTEPRLWFILGLCLEYQNRLKDALVAYKVSSNLAQGATTDDEHHHSQHHHRHHHKRRHGKPSTAQNNFQEPHLRYALLCIRVRGDFKRAAQVLSRVVANSPQNYDLYPLLSLIKCSGLTGSNSIHLNEAMETLSTVENRSALNWNPSSNYNALTLRCQQRSLLETSSWMMLPNPEIKGDDDIKFKLQYLLIKAHIQVNNMLQDSSQSAILFSRPTSHQLNSDKKVEELIEQMRNSDVSCWQSSSLWNNLGLCYLIKGKLIASLTCLMKALESGPLDWRIHYNLALACIQAGLVPRAVSSLIAARQLHGNNASSIPRIITSLMAICFEKLGQVDEARRLHIEATRSQAAEVANKPINTPILAIINYLIFLHRGVESGDGQTVKLKLHLLDLVEQFWLQRNQNDGQFNAYLLDVAYRIGQESSNQIFDGAKMSARKTYAWTKVG